MIIKMNYVFGDGCLNSFTIDNVNNWEINRIRGYTIEKLLSKNNTVLNKILSFQEEDINLALFIFGQNDVFYNYYQNLFVDKEKLDIDKLIKNYVTLINNLKFENNKKIIISVLPSNAGEKEFKKKVKDRFKIKNLTKEQDYYYFSNNMINKRREKFNQILKKYCLEYKIKYINFDKEILNKNKKIKEKYLAKDRYSLHFVWEYQQEIITKKLNKMKYKINIYKPDLDSIKKFN